MLEKNQVLAPILPEVTIESRSITFKSFQLSRQGPQSSSAI